MFKQFYITDSDDNLIEEFVTIKEALEFLEEHYNDDNVYELHIKEND